MALKRLCVTLDDVPQTLLPRTKAIFERLLRDQERIAHIAKGKIVFNVGDKSIVPVYEEQGEPIVAA